VPVLKIQHYSIPVGTRSPAQSTPQLAIFGPAQDCGGCDNGMLCHALGTVPRRNTSRTTSERSTTDQSIDNAFTNSHLPLHRYPTISTERHNGKLIIEDRPLAAHFRCAGKRLAKAKSRLPFVSPFCLEFASVLIRICESASEPHIIPRSTQYRRLQCYY